jgi:DNA-binding response OmpR family regulator
MKILFIDERSDTLEFLESSIINFGCKPGIARHRDDIVPMLSNDQYDVVVANGCAKELDVEQQIRKKYPSVFIVFLSGSHKKGTDGPHGADLYLQRPFEVSRLHNIISFPRNRIIGVSST